MIQTNNDVKRHSIQAAKKQREKDQNDILTGIIDNESKTYTFDKEISVGNKKQKGTFVAKYMGVAARLRIGVIRARLLEGAPQNSLDPIADDIAYMIAYLTVALVKTPAWFSYEEMDEIGELRGLYQEVNEFVKSFRGNDGTSTNAGHSSDASSTENMENQ